MLLLFMVIINNWDNNNFHQFPKAWLVDLCFVHLTTRHHSVVRYRVMRNRAQPIISTRKYFFALIINIAYSHISFSIAYSHISFSIAYPHVSFNIAYPHTSFSIAYPHILSLLYVIPEYKIDYVIGTAISFLWYLIHV